ASPLGIRDGFKNFLGLFDVTLAVVAHRQPVAGEVDVGGLGMLSHDLLVTLTRFVVESAQLRSPIGQVQVFFSGQRSEVSILGMAEEDNGEEGALGVRLAEGSTDLIRRGVVAG